MEQQTLYAIYSKGSPLINLSPNGSGADGILTCSTRLTSFTFRLNSK